MNLKESDIIAAMEHLERNRPPQERKFVLMTGQGGYDRINFVMRREPAKGLLNELRAFSLINDNEFDRLTQMINSPDDENLVMAEMIMEEKKKLKYEKH